MTLFPDDDLRAICESITRHGWSEEEWAARESDDMFQHGRYRGGFDATEGEFCFEAILNGAEYWFQFSLAEAARLAAGELIEIKAREAEL